ncbi:TIGR00725 family protein [Laspinema olomoucense]|uniref:TIGR00725 family protein n=1 Tax=Laspinema olomoucense TaxID=3231600 RepID=UPI0021BA40F2|nr:TIGR00725 family protein [Laspinema sp. D3a]MCT7987314.1 TIGR00725 family protein [Laspinema sp. D3a]
MRKFIIGVMGPGSNATKSDLNHAYKLGKLIAEQGWILLTGGRKAGVMDAASQGAKSANGLTLGILPGEEKTGISDAIDIAILTGIGSARNNINVLTSDVVIACGMGTGTASEIALALKAGKPVILLNDSRESHQFFTRLSHEQVISVQSPEEAIARVREILARQDC